MPHVLVYMTNYASYDTPTPPVPQILPPDTTMTFKVYDDTTYPLPITGRLAGRFLKALPPRDIPHNFSIYLDANIPVTSPHMVADFLSHLSDGDIIALFRHIDRDNIIDEAGATIGMPKYAEVQSQHHDFVSRFPMAEARALGLFELHAIARRSASGTMERLGQEWWRQTLEWSRPGPGGVFIDQILLPPLLHSFGIRPAIILGSVWTNLWWTSDSGHTGITPEHP